MSTLVDAETIVVGGGAVGLGVTYALAKAGLRDIVVLERAPDVGSVTTSQGAGLCGQVRDTPERIRLAMHSVSVFRELQRSPVPPEWREVGSLRIALSARRREEFQRLQKLGTVAFCAAIDGAVYARHGTTIETRLTVIDKRPAADATTFPASQGVAPDAATLLRWVQASVPRDGLQPSLRPPAARRRSGRHGSDGHHVGAAGPALAQQAG